MRIAAIKARFYGLYEWGEGWVSADKEKAWRDFFLGVNRNRSFTHWGYLPGDTASDGGNLVCVSGSAYVHPMDMTCVIHTNVFSRRFVDGDWEEYYPELEEFMEVARCAAKACGGSVVFSEKSVCDLADPQFKEELDDGE